MAREGNRATAQKGFEVFERNFRGWHKPSARQVWDSVEVSSVERNRHHFKCFSVDFCFSVV